LSEKHEFTSLAIITIKCDIEIREKPQKFSFIGQVIQIQQGKKNNNELLSPLVAKNINILRINHGPVNIIFYFLYKKYLFTN